MSDFLKHECGVAAIRLLKPLSYFQDKYGSTLWAFNKLLILMEKQYNRGQDGAGIGCVKLNMPLGQPYLFRTRDASKDALTSIFNGQIKKLNKKVRRGLVNLKDAADIKNNFDYGGEILPPLPAPHQLADPHPDGSGQLQHDQYAGVEPAHD